MATMDWTAQAESAARAYQEFLVGAMFVHFSDRLVEGAGVKKGAKVLDVACGTGAVARAAAKAAGTKGAVTGIDLGEPMLEVARQQPAPKGAAPIEYAQGDATRLRALDDTFDVVLCQQGLQFIPDKGAALAEMLRVLKPGGTAAIACWVATPATPMLAVAEAVDTHLGPEAAGMLRSLFAVSTAELGQLVAMAGFGDLEVSAETIEIDFGPVGDFARRLIESNPMRSWAETSDELRRAITADASEKLAERAPDGQLRVPMTTSVAIAHKQDW